MKKQKVLIVDDFGGSSFHRCVLPSKYLQGKVVKFGEEEVELDFVVISRNINEKILADDEVQNGDIIWFNWNIGNSLADIARWRAKKSIKLLYSIDDLWEVSVGNPTYDKIVKQRSKVIQWIAEADIVICSTERLGNHVLQYTKRVIVNHNFLPVGDGQFVSNKEESDKLRVGILGSGSHLPDYRMLKNAINRISKNKELCEKMEFHICGYGDLFKEIKDMIAKKKNISLKLHESLPVNEYMKLYDNIDVILCPLEEIEYNYCKSSLKLAECLASKTIPIGSRIYETKELGGIGIAETPLEYEKWLEHLCNKDSYKKTLDYFTEINGKDNKFEQRIDNLLAVFETLVNVDLSNKLDNIKIYSITYDENQVAEYEQYDNSHIRSLEQKSYLFEWNPIVDIISNKIDDYKGHLGIFSWKFGRKTGFTKNILYKILHEKKFQEYDFINLTKEILKNGKEYMLFTEMWHPGILERIEEVCNVIGLEYTDVPEITNFSNFYLMKAEYYKDFVNNYIKPAIEYMELKPERFMVDAQYKSGLEKEKLKELTGLDFYPFQTFILERLILFYIKDKNLKILSVFNG